MMESPKNSPDQWDACQSGEVRQLVDALKKRRRVRTMQRGGGVALLLMMVLFSSFFVMGILPQAERNDGGIVCSKVQQFAEKFRAGDLDAELADKIRAHLKTCPQCQKRMEEFGMNSAPQQTTTTAAGWIRANPSRRNLAGHNSPDAPVLASARL
jgi:hypothetical protein